MQSYDYLNVLYHFTLYNRNVVQDTRVVVAEDSQCIDDRRDISRRAI